ncbi:MAG: hypothetical protein A2143_02260 [Gallionellales bacterium RBG_16_57_15]|nr:MAG: hypothetical protein A2143_02260 [Gallionellales bacterium RBG_16_57_15]
MAGIETDRTVGHCAGLLSVLQKPERVVEAIGYADNQQRAIQMASAWISKLSSSSPSVADGMVWSATSSCREIGLRTGD